MSVQTTTNNDKFSLAPWNPKGFYSRKRYHGLYHHARVYKKGIRVRGSHSEAAAEEINWRNDGLLIDTAYGVITVY